MIVTVLGWSGAAALLVAYALVSRQRVAGDGFTYQALNVYGAAAVSANSAVHRAWPSVGLNVMWIGIGVVALRRVARRRGGRTTQAPAA